MSHATDLPGHPHGHDHAGSHDHAARHEHGHTHGLVDRSILESRAGLRAVAQSLVVLAAAAVLQLLAYLLTGSVALLADLVHNAGDALTALPLGIAFWSRSRWAEQRAGYVVVAVILASAGVALWQSIERLLHPMALHDLVPLALAGVIGLLGNAAAARIRTRAGRRLHSPALIADGAHARADGYVSLSVAVAAGFVALGLRIADPIIGILLGLFILRITAQALATVRDAPR